VSGLPLSPRHGITIQPLTSLRLTAPFRVQSESSSQLHTVSVIGELDQSTAPELRGALAPSLGQPTGSVLVDLSDCEFIDSTGLSLLVETKRRLDELQRGFAICCPDADVRRLLELTGIDQALRLFETRDEAVATLADGSG
jgi:anti-sigma B factor antagonist